LKVYNCIKVLGLRCWENDPLPRADEHVSDTVINLSNRCVFCSMCGVEISGVTVFVRSPLLHFLRGRRVGGGRDDSLFDDVVPPQKIHSGSGLATGVRCEGVG
jgi:hypothetical protein